MKREKFLWPLSQSHHRALVAAKRVRESLGAASPNDLSAEVEKAFGAVQVFFNAELRRHFWEEEQILTLFEGHVGKNDSDTNRLRQEHRLLETLAGEKTKESLLRFAETLATHVRFEEDVLFGRIQEVLGPDEKETTGDRLTRYSCEIPTE
jgi:hemerythrin superfamily protein